jgi:rhamnogalacturonyl hydrolase YesR
MIMVSSLVVGCAGLAAEKGNAFFRDWPDGASPAKVGKSVAENFLQRQFDFQTNPRRRYVIYPEACTWYGALTLAKLTNDKDLADRLIKKFDYLLTPEGSKHISPEPHVDYRVFGIVPLEIYMQTKDMRYLDIGLSLADAQWAKTTDDGITAEARYWIDDMYMITAVQTQAYRATGQAKYIDRAALAMCSYLDRLQQPNGLFYHALDVPFHWGRGNGWVAAGMTELLRSLPEDHPRRPRIMAGYKKMMEALLKYQDPNGMWRQLIDRPESWPETSSTGMFTFAMVTGVKNGWLDEQVYGPAARKAWLALVGFIDENANVRQVCVGTNKFNDYQYYIDRPRSTGDLHGQAPVLWTASALLR